MKIHKYIATFLAGASLMVGLQAFAEDGLQKIEAYIRTGLPITLDGKKVELESPAVVVDGSTYLKLRDVAKLTGLDVLWNEQTQTIELSSKVVPADQKNTKTTQNQSKQEDKYSGKIFVSGADLGQIFNTPERSVLSLVDKSKEQNNTFYEFSTELNMPTMYYSIDFLVGLGINSDELKSLPKYKVSNGKIIKIEN